MPHYVNDPENPGQRIDVIELLRRDPLTPPPVNVEGLLKRDLWTRQEALLILAGLAPHNVVGTGGMPIGIIRAGIVYLDGTTSAQLDAHGLQHPRDQEWLPEFMDLTSYASGQDMNEHKTPAEWLAWADSKAFKPYWLEAARMAGLQPGRLQGEGHAAHSKRQEAEKRAAGRYTLWDAAKLIGEQSHTPHEAVLERLIDAATTRQLRIYRAGENFSYIPAERRKVLYGHEASSFDLNAWLEVHEPTIAWRFPEPACQKSTPAGNSLIEGEDAADFIECANNEGEPIDWRDWVADRPVLKAGEAARLMAGLEPHTHASLQMVGRHDSAWAAKRKARDFEEKAASQGMERASPAAWLAWGESQGKAVHIGFRLAMEQYAAPAVEAATGTRPMKWQRHQEQEILRVLAEKGFTATALPKLPKKNRAGGAKAIVRAELKWEGTKFDKAWERLRHNKDIRDAE
ncbi:hypothetical protein THIX_90662 [Thiomonas sp. X19]|uniref:hypothetical protein n=1 Tax=Thiomonas sp. X19 TaxID=1050370 RepID=UPI000B657D0D|nr:hypothetical protein [Thiomonas sp. X19]SCC95887.1 hypothetical protein THIX_90662 [Thiomonas sp. X19]